MSTILKMCLFLTAAVCMPLNQKVWAQEEDIEHEKEEAKEADKQVAPTPPAEKPEGVPSELPPVVEQSSEASGDQSTPIIVTATESPVLISIAPAGEPALDVIRNTITNILESAPPHDAALVEQARNVPPDTMRDFGRWLATEQDRTIATTGLELLSRAQEDALYDGFRTGLEEMPAATVSFTTRVLEGLQALSDVVGAFPIGALVRLFTVITPLFTDEAMSLASEEQIERFNKTASSIIDRLQEIFDTAGKLRDQFVTLRDQILNLNTELQQVLSSPTVATGL